MTGDGSPLHYTAAKVAEMTGTELPDYDLGQLAAEGIKPPKLIAGGMLYPAAVHNLAGAPGGGKTTLMAWWMLQHLRARGRVMLLDEESGPEQAAEKFLDLGAKPGELSPPWFTYVPFPAHTRNAADRAQLFDRIAERQPASSAGTPLRHSWPSRGWTKTRRPTSPGSGPPC